MTPAEFWATKSKKPEYMAIVFNHPEFDEPIRLVADQFAEVTLGGYVHTPVPMKVNLPDQSGDPIQKLSVSFPRPVVGRQFKQRLKAISAGGRMSPITVSYRHYIHDDLENPAMSYDLYVARDGGVVFTSDAVQVTATDVNPMRLNVSQIYDPAVFTGLAGL